MEVYISIISDGNAPSYKKNTVFFTVRLVCNKCHLHMYPAIRKKTPAAKL